MWAMVVAAAFVQNFLPNFLNIFLPTFVIVKERKYNFTPGSYVWQFYDGLDVDSWRDS